jgi:hypothetical protein
MTVQLDHTIVSAYDRKASANFLSEILGLPSPAPFGPFMTVQTDNDITLDFIDASDVVPAHYAFLVSEDDFDEIFGRIRERALPYWADPRHLQPGEINIHNGGRGVYFDDPSGHNLEILTRPYGSGN